MEFELERKRMFHTFAAAADAGPYDELPVLRDGIDPQVHLSRNDRPQPFFLVCSRDTLVTQLSGSGELELRYCGVRSHPLDPGDVVYVPAGAPSRYVPDGIAVVLRYKALVPGLEGVVWFCASCESEVHRDEFDTAEEIPQAAYWRACQEFNAKVELRTCPSCGEVHPPVPVEGVRWPQIAEALRSAG